MGPVSKVITLLKDMLKQLEKEAEEDEEIYDKVACWCETNDKEKTKAIADAEAKIADLTVKIEELTAASARLNTEIKNLEKEVAANQEALDQATAIREKQLAEFNAEEKETFEANLSDAQKEEMANQKAYEDLKAAKEAEIAAGQSQIDTKTQELADTDEKLAQAKEDIEDTRNSLAADEKFLMMLKEKCQMTDKEWEERQKTRQLEMEAVSKALAILSGDDAHDLFTRTF